MWNLMPSILSPQKKFPKEFKQISLVGCFIRFYPNYWLVEWEKLCQFLSGRLEDHLSRVNRFWMGCLLQMKQLMAKRILSMREFYDKNDKEKAYNHEDWDPLCACYTVWVLGQVEEINEEMHFNSLLSVLINGPPTSSFRSSWGFNSFIVCTWNFTFCKASTWVVEKTSKLFSDCFECFEIADQ